MDFVKFSYLYRRKQSICRILTTKMHFVILKNVQQKQLMTENRNIRKTVKNHLKNRDYKKAIEYLDSYTNSESVRTKISIKLSEYTVLEQKFDKNLIDNKSFFYGINKVVLDVLDITDEITGEPEDDWDFIDELNSTLKFNLIENPQKNNMQHRITDESADVIEKNLTEAEIIEQEKELKDIIRKLIGQLHKYEELELSSKNDEEKKKYHDIIEGINSQILSYSKRLKKLIPEE